MKRYWYVSDGKDWKKFDNYESAKEWCDNHNDWYIMMD